MKTSFVYLPLLFVCSQVWGSKPDWKPDSYKNKFGSSMFLTSKVVLEGAELNNENDMLAAFYNGELRGVTNAALDEGSGSYIFLLSIFGDSESVGQKMDLKVYRSSTDEVVELEQKVEFVSSKEVGSVTDSFILADENFINDFDLSTKSFAANEFVDKFNVTYALEGNTNFVEPVFELFSVSNEPNDNGLFEIRGDELWALDRKNVLGEVYVVSIRATNSNGIIIDKKINLVARRASIPSSHYIITVNGDGINDELSFNIPLDGEVIQLLIYDNRMGLIYSSSDYQNDWGGTDAQSGTYFFEVTLGSDKYTGSISVLSGL